MHKIEICMGSACFAKGNQDNLEFLKQKIQEYGIEAEISGTLCENKCLEGPRIIIDGIEYKQVTDEKLEEILKTALKGE